MAELLRGLAGGDDAGVDELGRGAGLLRGGGHCGVGPGHAGLNGAGVEIRYTVKARDGEWLVSIAIGRDSSGAEILLDAERAYFVGLHLLRLAAAAGRATGDVGQWDHELTLD